MEPRDKKRLITSFSIDIVADLTPGSGKVLDLTATGCRIRSNVAYNFPKHMSLSLESTTASSSFRVERATVRWIKDDELGVEFVKVSSEDQEKLADFLRELETMRREFKPYSPEPRQVVQTVEVEKTPATSWWKESFSR